MQRPWLTMMRMAGLAMWAARLMAQPAAEPVNPVQEALALLPLQSAALPLYASGRSPDEKSDLLKWSEEIIQRLERITGRPVVFEHRAIYIISRHDATNKAGPELFHAVQQDTLMQQLTLYDYPETDQAAARHALCTLLLDGYQLETMAIQADGKPDWRRASQHGPPQIPAWLSIGVARNLFPVLKAENNAQSARLWQEGRIPSLRRLLAQYAAPAASFAADPGGTDSQSRNVACGLLIALITAQPNRADIFNHLLAELAAGRPITPATLAARFPKCATGADMEDAWDRWLFRQRYIIHQPGRFLPENIAQLRAELLLYPGVSGIPLATNASQVLTFGYLVEQREAPWAPALAEQKINALRRLTAGRGAELGAVADAYCRFLSALKKQAGKRKLKKLLQDAEGKLNALDRKAVATGPGPNEGEQHGNP